jgi:GrpB-like predicted nucleotidyltransferase (UPF0157 family)
VIGIRVQTENIKTQEIKHTNSSYFTMVAMGEDFLPAQVPGLILEDYLQVKRFYEAYHRKELKRYYDQQHNEIRNDAELAEAIELISKERCKIEFKDQSA